MEGDEVQEVNLQITGLTVKWAFRDCWAVFRAQPAVSRTARPSSCACEGHCGAGFSLVSYDVC